MAFQPSPKKTSDGEWMRYLGLASQFFGSILIALGIGWKLDAVFGFTAPILIWILPLLAVVFNLIKIIIDTNKHKP